MNTNAMKCTRAKPFLKWAGGKTQLLDQFKKYFPKELEAGQINNYYEPFLGSGAIFFYVMQNYPIKEAFLNELNTEIYLCYTAIQENVEGVIEQLKRYQRRYRTLNQNKKSFFYYEKRNEYNEGKRKISHQNYDTNWVKRAALTILLNRTCYNGLYRVNSAGDFNVPFGNYPNPAICDEDNLRAVNKVMKNVTITNDDFSIVKKKIKDNSFIYFDPPYRPLNKTSSFRSYSANDFNDNEQRRLASLVKEIHENRKMVKLMLSNSDPKNVNNNDHFFENIFSEPYFNIFRLKARRMINCKPEKRGEINEILVTNYAR